MPFIGTPLDTRNTFQSLVGKRFSGDGSTTAFTLDVAPGSVLDIEVFVGNVRQDPNSAYTLSGTTLTFTGAPPSGTNNIYVVHQAKSVGTIDVPALGVSTASIQADAVTEAKIADDAVESEHLNNNIISGQTELAATPADTDEFLVSDAGTIKRIDYSYIKGSSTIGGLTDVVVDATNFTDGILIQTNSDGSAPTTGTLSSAENNIGIGKDVFKSLTSGDKNVAIGGTAHDELTTGLENTAIGYGAGHKITSGNYNHAIGSGALDAQVTGNNCVAVGHDALGWLDGSNSVGVGWQAGGSSAGANSLYLGYQSYGSGNQNEILLTGSGNPVSAGENSFTFGKNGNRVYNQFNSNNNWTHSSDERMKKNIQDETLGLSFINRLRPVTYNFRLPSEYPEDFPYYDAENKNPKTDQLQHGIIAQEVKEAMTAEGNDTFNGYQLANDGVHSVSESNFIYPMIKAMQELSAKVDALETENTALKARVTTLEE
jgi:hypothetical protein